MSEHPSTLSSSLPTPGLADSSSCSLCLKGDRALCISTLGLQQNSLPTHPLKSVNSIQLAPNANCWILSPFPPLHPAALDGMHQNDCLLGSLLSLLIIMASPAPPWLMTGHRNPAQLRGQVSHHTLPSPLDYVDLQGHSASERQSQESTHALCVISFCLSG